MTSKNKLTIYRFFYRNDNQSAAIRNEGLDKDAVEKVRQAFIAENRGIVSELDQVEHHSDLYEWNTSTPYISFISEGSVKAGERHTDSRCTGQKPFYTTPALLEEAKQRFNDEKKGQEVKSDRYYSQPWV